MTDEALLAQVQMMRERGCSPKQIAKALGLRPAAVTPLVRRVAAVEQSPGDPADRVVVGCWISPGWSAGLGLGEAPAAWAALDQHGVDERAVGGVACVLIARRERASQVMVCGFLVDVYCLGVKKAAGPVRMGSGAVETFSRRLFSPFDGPPVSVPLELAQAVVHGAAAYARGLGFEPHPGFAAAARYLGTPARPSPILFGCDGKPFYVSGLYGKPQVVIETLEATVGAGNYDYAGHG